MIHRLPATWRAHVHTVLPTVVDRLRPRAAPPSVSWSTSVEDRRLGPLTLTGRLRVPDGARDLVVLLHGLGGSADSFYVRHAAHEADALGLASLRLDVRGAGRRGDALSHAGLTDDLHAALASEALAPFRRLHLLGFSLGGHTALRAAVEPRLDPRVAGVATLCSPLRLAAGAAWIDQPARAVYRRHVLSGLREIYGAMIATRPGPVSSARAASIDSLRAWDAEIVAPWFGFRGLADYYDTAGVAGKLDALRAPALVVHAAADPMVPLEAVVPAAAATDRVDLRLVPGGGHLVVDDAAATGLPGPGPVVERMLRWLTARAG